MRKLLCRLGFHVWRSPYFVTNFFLDPEEAFVGCIKCAPDEQWCLYCDAERVQVR